MHEFNYRNSHLYCESIKVSELAERYGTPLYIYSKATILDHYRKIKEAFREFNPLICYSMKANSNITIVKLLIREGAGLDIVSGGELYIALQAGASPRRIVYAGVGKTEKEIEMAIRHHIFLFNVESEEELGAIDRIAGRLGIRQRVAIRINPGVRPGTHRYIITGNAINKFGIDMGTARDIFLNAARYHNLQICGIHMHIGSQIIEASPFIKALRKITEFIEALREDGIVVRWMNIGGGLGIIYSDERPQTAKEYAKAVSPLLKKLHLNIILEPGRFIVGNAGILVTKVLYIKKTPFKNFAIVDAGMNDLIRPSFYGAYHEILPVVSPAYNASKKICVFDIVGPVCESSDFLATDRKFIDLKAGHLLAIMGAGSYGLSMSSNYNSRLRAAEVMVDEKSHILIRRREVYKDLVRTERHI